MPRIIRNAIRCKKCGDIIESKTVHDFKFCSCGSCAVDGGRDYIRRCGNREDWEELSEVEKVEDKDSLTSSWFVELVIPGYRLSSFAMSLRIAQGWHRYKKRISQDGCE